MNRHHPWMGRLGILILLLACTPACTDDGPPIITIGNGLVEGMVVAHADDLSGSLAPTAAGAVVPVANATVEISDVGLRATSDQDGRFLFLKVPAGSHRLTVIKDNNQDGTPELASEVVRFTLSNNQRLNLDDVLLQPTGSIAGKVTRGGLTLGNEGVTVFIPGTSYSAFSDDEGNFVISSVPPGTYDVAAHDPGYAISRWQAVEVVSEQTTEVSLKLLTPVDPESDETGAISGGVLLAGRDDHSGVSVKALPAEASVQTAADGTFTLTNLEEGLYQVQIRISGFISRTVPNVPVFAGGLAWDLGTYTLNPALSSQVDTDGDGIDDNVDDDIDGDGIPNDQDVFDYDPNEGGDSDGDGVGDGADLDGDNDGWPDSIEQFCGSDPDNAADEPLDTDDDQICNAADSDDDNDGWSDGDEQSCATDPLSAESVPSDSDADGLCDLLDAESGDNVDSDGDGVIDLVEAACESDPDDAEELPTDTDGDDTCDALDADDDGDTWTDALEAACGSDPLVAGSTPADTDGDLQCDALDTDDDGDTWTDALEAACGSNPLLAGDQPLDTDGDLDCDVLDEDDDNDTWSDALETACGSNPLLAGDLPLDTDGDLDCNVLDDDDDADGFSDTHETTCGSDPLLDSDLPDDLDGDLLCDGVDPDIDGDGYSNLIETTASTDINDELSFPAPPETTLTTGPAPLTVATTASFSFASTSPFVVGFECDVDDGGYADCASPFVTAPLANGRHTFRVRALDVAGVADPSPATQTWHVTDTSQLNFADYVSDTTIGGFDLGRAFVHPDGGVLYHLEVSGSGVNTQGVLCAITLEPLSEVCNVFLGYGFATDLVFHPDGRRLFVNLSKSQGITNTLEDSHVVVVSIDDPTAPERINSVDLHNSSGYGAVQVAISPLGTRLYVPERGIPGWVNVLDVSTYGTEFVEAHQSQGSSFFPSSAAFSPDGSLALLMASDDSRVRVYDALSATGLDVEYTHNTGMPTSSSAARIYTNGLSGSDARVYAINGGDDFGIFHYANTGMTNIAQYPYDVHNLSVLPSQRQLLLGTDYPGATSLAILDVDTESPTFGTFTSAIPLESEPNATYLQALDRFVAFFDGVAVLFGRP